MHRMRPSFSGYVASNAGRSWKHRQRTEPESSRYRGFRIMIHPLPQPIVLQVDRVLKLVLFLWQTSNVWSSSLLGQESFLPAVLFWTRSGNSAPRCLFRQNDAITPSMSVSSMKGPSSAKSESVEHRQHESILDVSHRTPNSEASKSGVGQFLLCTHTSDIGSEFPVKGRMQMSCNGTVCSIVHSAKSIGVRRNWEERHGIRHANIVSRPRKAPLAHSTFPNPKRAKPELTQP